MKKKCSHLLLYGGMIIVNHFFGIAQVFSQPPALPFQGKITGTFINKSTNNPAVYNGGAEASGNASYLGTFTKVTNDVINIVSSTIEGTFTMKNNAGEQLEGNYSGTFSLGPDPGSLSWNLKATITKGTGRFSKASGTFVFLANGNFVIADGVVKRGL